MLLSILSPFSFFQQNEVFELVKYHFLLRFSFICDITTLLLPPSCFMPRGEPCNDGSVCRLILMSLWNCKTIILAAGKGKPKPLRALWKPKQLTFLMSALFSDGAAPSLGIVRCLPILLCLFFFFVAFRTTGKYRASPSWQGKDHISCNSDSNSGTSW